MAFIIGHVSFAGPSRDNGTALRQPLLRRTSTGSVGGPDDVNLAGAANRVRFRSAQTPAEFCDFLIAEIERVDRFFARQIDKFELELNHLETEARTGFKVLPSCEMPPQTAAQLWSLVLPRDSLPKEMQHCRLGSSHGHRTQPNLRAC